MHAFSNSLSEAVWCETRICWHTSLTRRTALVEFKHSADAEYAWKKVSIAEIAEFCNTVQQRGPHAPSESDVIEMACKHPDCLVLAVHGPRYMFVSLYWPTRIAIVARWTALRWMGGPGRWTTLHPLTSSFLGGNGLKAAWTRRRRVATRPDQSALQGKEEQLMVHVPCSLLNGSGQCHTTQPPSYRFQASRQTVSVCLVSYQSLSIKALQAHTAPTFDCRSD